MLSIDNINDNINNMTLERNEFDDLKWIDENGETIAELINGEKKMLSREITRGPFCRFTIILTNDMGRTWVILENYHEALDTCNNAVEKWNKTKVRRESINEYCKNNKWTYSGT